jgi:hypothetical protein
VGFVAAYKVLGLVVLLSSCAADSHIRTQQAPGGGGEAQTTRFSRGPATFFVQNAVTSPLFQSHKSFPALWRACRGAFCRRLGTSMALRGANAPDAQENVNETAPAIQIDDVLRMCACNVAAAHGPATLLPLRGGRGKGKRSQKDDTHGAKMMLDDGSMIFDMRAHDGASNNKQRDSDEDGHVHHEQDDDHHHDHGGERDDTQQSDGDEDAQMNQQDEDKKPRGHKSQGEALESLQSQASSTGILGNFDHKPGGKERHFDAKKQEKATKNMNQKHSEDAAKNDDMAMVVQKKGGVVQGVPLQRRRREKITFEDIDDYLGSDSLEPLTDDADDDDDDDDDDVHDAQMDDGDGIPDTE